MKGLLGKKPIFGICLGHQLLGLALGAKTFKLKFGHRGANQPVLNETTGQVEITTQNHGFAVDPASLPRDVEPTHINLNDRTLEGMRHGKLPVFSVQYHPEASAGPHDSQLSVRGIPQSNELTRLLSLPILKRAAPVNGSSSHCPVDPIANGRFPDRGSCMRFPAA